MLTIFKRSTYPKINILRESIRNLEVKNIFVKQICDTK